MSMTREQMLRYMEIPAMLNERTQGELKEILDEFPYFQTAHLLYTRNLMNESSFRYSNQLKICAVHATDRKVLYQLLHPKDEKETLAQLPEIEVIIKKEDVSTESFELSEDENITNTVLVPSSEKPTASREKSSFDLLNFEPGEMGYRLEGEDSETEKPLEELANELRKISVKNAIPASEKPKEDLIDRFIRENPIMQSRANTPVLQEELAGADEDPKEGDEFITETLARIYLNQGLYQKAIKAFQRLSLKYPEKSVYFARQIAEITKLLNK